MSRFAFALSLVVSLSAGALAEKTSPDMPVASHAFAQPPDGADIAMPMMADRAAVRAKLAKMRTANLMRFRVYQKKGVFPSNTFTDGKLNVWLDRDGHFCAAATIIKASGQDDLVNQVADQNNFIRLADVTQGPLMDWILTSGLTQAEIAAIQEPFMPVVTDPSLEPQPEPIIVDNGLRRAENRRLLARYKKVDSQIVKATKKSLDVATDRLMANPDLAWSFLNS